MAEYGDDLYGNLNAKEKADRDYKEGRARKITAEAERLELELAETRGDLVRRSKARDAAITAMAMFAQTVRGLPDQLERTCNLSPTQAQKLAEGLDDALANLAKTFRELNGGE